MTRLLLVSLAASGVERFPFLPSSSEIGLLLNTNTAWNRFRKRFSRAMALQPDLQRGTWGSHQSNIVSRCRKLLNCGSYSHHNTVDKP